MSQTHVPLSDRLHDVERQFKQHPSDGESDLYERRLILRRAFEDYGRECYDQGYRDGVRDLGDARWEAETLRARLKVKAAPGEGER